MSRKLRFVLPGVPRHVVQRGHNREPCFFAHADYQRYLHDFHQAALKNRVQIHAYVLMTTRLHLLLTPETPYGRSHTMQSENCVLTPVIHCRNLVLQLSQTVTAIRSRPNALKLL